jgi:hypothetical protein
MKTYEQYMKDAPRSHRAWAAFALMGAASLVAAVTGASKLVALLIASALFLAVNTFIWLRQNPTLKQIERRRKRAAEGSPETSEN